MIGHTASQTGVLL